jgi:polygalacturonase
MRHDVGGRDRIHVRDAMVVRGLSRPRPLVLLFALVGCGTHAGANPRATVDSGSSASGPGSGCGNNDPSLPVEPTVPPPCATLQATQSVTAGAQPSENALDTDSIQAAMATCPSGGAVRLVTDGGNNAFVSGPLRIPSGVSLWIDRGTTLYASRNPSVYGASCGTTGGTCSPFITASGTGQGIVGDGTIDGQGGEPLIGQSQSWWELNSSTNASAAIPTLVRVMGATNFTMYRTVFHNAPKFHVVLGSKGFVVWGVTIKTPSAATNSQGALLSAAGAPNTDGIDPGQQASDGFIVCSKISVGDDQIAIKGGTGVTHLSIAHNRFGFGHGMSIGSETNGGVSDINVYDLSIDGTDSGMGGGSSNGIRIKSDSSVGGLVSNVTYSDVCVRNVRNPIILTPRYSGATGSRIPEYTGITIRDFHSFTTSASQASQTVTLDGYDASHLLGITLDNVVVDGLSQANVKAMFANVTLGPGSVSFTPSGTGVTVTSAGSGASQPNECADKWTTF